MFNKEMEKKRLRDYQETVIRIVLRNWNQKITPTKLYEKTVNKNNFVIVEYEESNKPLIFMKETLEKEKNNG
jgi:hypothetical protein